eukprot:5359449-Prymnesium_polylepis.1
MWRSPITTGPETECASHVCTQTGWVKEMGTPGPKRRKQKGSSRGEGEGMGGGRRPRGREHRYE